MVIFKLVFDWLERMLLGKFIFVGFKNSMGLFIKKIYFKGLLLFMVIGCF